MTPGFYVVGAGGFGRETMDALRVAAPAVAETAVFVDEFAEADTIDSAPVHRPDQVREGTFVVAIANVQVRRRLVEMLAARGLTAGQVIHPRAVISAGAQLERGCIVLANAFVSTAVRLGAHVQINYNATIGHDSVLHDYATVLPGANVSGTVTIESGATIGSNACVIQGLRIGAATMVGAGAVVTRDLVSDGVFAGVPARPLRK